MHKAEIKHQRIAAEGAISIANNLLIKLEENEKTIVESRIITETTLRLVSSINDVLRRVILELSHETVEKSISTLQTLASWLDDCAAKNKTDTTHIEGVQEGMRRALDAVKQTGTLRVAEIQRTLALAKDTQDDNKQKIDHHPKKLSIKRKAVEIKAKQDI